MDNPRGWAFIGNRVMLLVKHAAGHFMWVIDVDTRRHLAAVNTSMHRYPAYGALQMLGLVIVLSVIPSRNTRQPRTRCLAGRGPRVSLRHISWVGNGLPTDRALRAGWTWLCWPTISRHGLSNVRTHLSV